MKDFIIRAEQWFLNEYFTTEILPLSYYGNGPGMNLSLFGWCFTEGIVEPSAITA